MQKIKEELNENHIKYKEQRRLDWNLILRIDRLVKNVNKELKKEEIANRYQQSITKYMQQYND